MPQATDELRNQMNTYFQNGGIDDAQPYAFLKALGYSEKGGLLIKPNPEHKPTEKEYDCIQFLCDEWDYGFEG